MSPIFTSSNSKGLKGYNYKSFTSEFDSICNEHIKNERAKKFAFIVYDFHSTTHKTLENQGVFIELDRLSGKDITVFFLDGQLNSRKNNQNKLFKNLNKTIIELSEQKIENIPFIVFFDFADNEVSNFTCHSVRDDEKFILNDLVSAIKIELKFLNKKQPKNSSVMATLFKETPKIVYSEFIKMILNGIIKPDS